MSFITQLKGFFSGSEKAPSDYDLADLGISRLEYQHLTRSKPGTRRRMETMAARFGVSPQMIDADRGLAMELATTCGHCRNAKACQNAVELGVEFASGRCPNAATYADMSTT